MPRETQLRLARPEDAAACHEIYAPLVAETAITFETALPDPAEMARRIAAVLETDPWLIWEEDGRVLGYAYATLFRARPAYRWCREIAFYVRQGERGRGIGGRLLSGLLGVLRLQGCRVAVGAVRLPNTASERLMASAGFGRVGVFRRAGYKLGAWHDIAWWECDLGGPDPPPEPRPLPAVTGAEGWEEALRACRRLP